MRERPYTTRVLRGIRSLYRDKLLSLGIRRFIIENLSDRTGVAIVLPKSFPPGTRWDLVYGVKAELYIKPQRFRKRRS